jgi:hypothetical protein
MRTEFEFTLPRGYVDSSGNLHKRGWMRLARAKDVLLPLQDPRVQKNANYLAVILLSRVISKMGTLKLINPPVIEGLFSADLAYLIDFYKKSNERVFRQIGLQCEQCGKDFEGGIQFSGEQ